MADTILIVGRSQAARTVLPRLLEPLRCTIVFTDDTLSAVHVLERLRADFIVVDADADGIDGETFAALATRIPRLAEAPLHVLRGADAPADEVLARCEAFWASEAADADVRATLPALLACVAA